MTLARFLLRVASSAVSSSSAAGRFGSQFHRNVPYSSAAAAAARSSSNRNFTSPTNESGNELYRRISPVGDPKVSIVPILDRWIEEGNSVEKHQLVSYIKELRYFGRHYHALEISKWMTDKRYLELTSRDAAIRLDLIAKVQGLKPAANFFETLPQQLKGINVYGALLNCYCRVQAVEKAEAVMQEIRELGLNKEILCYNTLLGLYNRMEDTKKFEDLVKEVDACGIAYDVVTYNILITSFGAASDVKGMEKTLIRMEANPDVTPDWAVYNTAATNYRKAELFDKAVQMLEKAEGLIRTKKDIKAYYYLLTSYAAMGKKDEVLAVWSRLKKRKNGKVLNKGYMDVISSLSKLGDFETAEKILDEWESSRGSSGYDVRIPNILVSAYMKVGRLEEAEAVVERMRSKGVEPHANSWLSLAVGYLDHHKDASKAVGAMKRGVMSSESGWKPDPRGLADCLQQLKDAGGDRLEEAKELVQLLMDENVVPLAAGKKWLMDGSSDQVEESAE